MRTISIIFIAIFSFTTACFSQRKAVPVPVIFDSDMGPDYDDVGAITILHALADKGEAKILATMASTNYEGVAGVLNIFNTYFNRPDLPIGVPKGNALSLRDWQHWTDTLLAKYPHQLKTNNQAADAVSLYRKLLAGQPDNSVTIVTVGFLTNLSNLLNTSGDSYSPLTGIGLVKKKVKQLVCMAGKFPSGWEFNVMKDAQASKNVYDNWPTQIIFSGFEIGVKIKAGLPLINNKTIANSPVKNAFRIAIPMAREDSLGRSSWDETAVLIAIKGYSQWYTLHSGKMKVADDGSNAWDDTANGQAYIAEKVNYTVVQDLINQLIMHQPVKRVNRRSTGQTRSSGGSRMSQSTENRIAQIEALGRKVDKIEANINKREREIKRVEAHERD
ncbi:MAG: nucleoside hydrolase [Mucilaginibacter sp.]